MKWRKVEKELPNPYELVWVFWRDREVVLGYRTYEDDPKGEKYLPCEGWYSIEDEKSKWAYYWKPLEEEELYLIATSLNKPLPPHV